VRWRAVLGTLLFFVALGALGALAIDGLVGGSKTGYLVRAVFDNSSFMTPGEDVKIAGVKVGTVTAVQLTPDNKAALVLSINDRQFTPFRTDAHCAIGLESLLGEQFVQCTPTEARAPGETPPPALSPITSGSNQGEHLLPVQNTTAPVGFDLLQDIQRLPQAERFRLIISGLGAGLAGNGQALNAALRRADPALQNTDRVIAVLASQDRLLARLTSESDQVLAPLAAQRAHLGGWIQHAGRVAVASAQEGQAIEQNLIDFPPFLRQLRPAAQHLANMAAQMTPALEELHAQAPAINAATRGLGPLAKSSIPALRSLGGFAARGEAVFPQAYRVALQLERLGTPLLPLANDIGGLAQSFDDAGGIEDVMRFIYYYGGAVNGETALGHYIRSLIEITTGVARTSTLVPSSSALFACTTGTNACGSGASAARAHGSGASAARAHGSGARPSRAGGTSDKPVQAWSGQSALGALGLPPFPTTPVAGAASLLHYLLAP
jgi:ABC-type transporter Mla subunit MlaD